MTKPRCKKTAIDSFFGNFLYERIILRSHLLVKLEEIVEWLRYTNKLLRYYKGYGEGGQAPYGTALILKILIISYLWG